MSTLNYWLLVGALAIVVVALLIAKRVNESPLRKRERETQREIDERDQ